MAALLLKLLEKAPALLNLKSKELLLLMTLKRLTHHVLLILWALMFDLMQKLWILDPV